MAPCQIHAPASRWSCNGGELDPQRPTHDMPLADVLHAVGRLIAHHWPTYYTQLADLLHTIGRLITCTLETQSDTYGRRCVVAGRPWQPPRVLARSWTELGGAGRLMTWHG